MKTAMKIYEAKEIAWANNNDGAWSDLSRTEASIIDAGFTAKKPAYKYPRLFKILSN